MVMIIILISFSNSSYPITQVVIPNTFNFGVILQNGILGGPGPNLKGDHPQDGAEKIGHPSKVILHGNRYHHAEFQSSEFERFCCFLTCFRTAMSTGYVKLQCTVRFMSAKMR